MIHRVIGTAGHIDHGKTSLVRALTGIDTDRLKEEKERGITIELGFAHLALPDGTQVGVVDVPGHERFVRTMVAGAVGIDLVVLVVAADEGVMPQTREHMDICSLLNVSRGVVALSKCDAVDAELRELAAADVAEALKGTFLEDAPVIPCSAKTGEGLKELVAAITDKLRDAPRKDPDGLLRLPIDRVFTMKGFGTVVTGTLWAGRLRVGDEVAAGATHGKVRGVQVHGVPVDQAVAGQRTAVNLSVPRESLERGQVLVHPGALDAGHLIDVRLQYLPTSKAPLKRRARVLYHAGTAQSLATVTLLDTNELQPGGTALAQLHLDAPFLLLPGDRFILRGFAQQKNHGTTLGGGVILRTLGARTRRGTPELLQILRANEKASPEERTLLEVERAGTEGISRTELQMRLPHEISDAALLGARKIIRYDKERGALVAATALDQLQKSAVEQVEAFHAAQPLAEGMPREELRAKLTEDVKLLHLVLESLAQKGVLVVERDHIKLPTHDTKKTSTDLMPLAQRATQIFRDAKLAPPRPAEVTVALAADLKELERVLDLLVRAGTLVRVKDLLFHQEAVDGLRARLIAFLVEKTQITPQEWKELVGSTRKFTIPLAEHFDAEKLTLRVGDLRKLRSKPVV